MTSLAAGASVLAAAATVVAAGPFEPLSRRHVLTTAVTVAAVVVTVHMLRRRAARNKLPPGYAQYPKQYVARRGTPPVIDGDVFKECWEKVPWSEPFGEIRGPADAPKGTGPTAAQATRMKMLWDDKYLYIAAVLDYPAEDELIAKFTARNSPIFHTDSDFEVFIDPAGCCHGYKELELNAINTVWNLMLNQPYSNGGKELSGRVAKPGEADYWEVKAQQTATRVTRGACHSPGEPAQWCCELALAHIDTLTSVPLGTAPSPGHSWRINFSRVEKQGQVNWVWSPQMKWNPGERRHAGEVNMHLPDAWGYVLFADSQGKIPGGEAEKWLDPAWPARAAATAVYYAAKAYESSNKQVPNSFQQLKKEGLLDGAFPTGVSVVLVPTTDGWKATAKVGGWLASISDKHFMRVEKA